MKIGGNARYFVKASSESEVVEALEFAASHELDVFVLGGGSNILIADKGFDGLVLQIGLQGIETIVDDECVLVTGQAGEDWDQFVVFCVNNALAGVECLSGIPGFVGGTPVQNVGAYGQEVSESIISVRCLDRKTLDVINLSNAECGFSYRKSIFNSTKTGRYIVFAVTFSLKKNGVPKIIYKDILDRLTEQNLSLSEVRETVLDIRRSKSMVIDRADPNSKSAGSFFKNPIVSLEKFNSINSFFPDIPNYPVTSNSIKLPAAWLIENAGFQKGFTRNNVGLSTKHTLALINRGNATAAEIIALKDEIQTKVNERFGIELQPEPIFVGF